MDRRGVTPLANDIFVIADTHFGHRKIIDYEPIFRPFRTIEEHDEALVAKWNAVVRKRDTVWHLGDVLFGSTAFAILPRLNGVKKLVMGNHDLYPPARYLQHFSRVCGAMEIGRCILTHVPVHPSQFRRYALNIHGHTHSDRIADPRYSCVSVEQTGLSPIPLEEARKGVR
jgi:calcineurin-like phosphoesterase family protein